MALGRWLRRCLALGEAAFGSVDAIARGEVLLRDSQRRHGPRCRPRWGRYQRLQFRSHGLRQLVAVSFGTRTSWAGRCLAQFGDNHVITEVELSELEQVPMALVPRAGTQVGSKRLHGLPDAGRGKPAENRHAGTDGWVEVFRRAPPEGSIEPVQAVPRNRRRNERHRPQLLVEPTLPGALGAIARRDELEEPRQVLDRQPEQVRLPRIGLNSTTR